MEELVHAGVKEVYLIDFEHESSLHSPIILNCFEREEMKFTKETPEQDEISKDDAILRVYSIIKPGRAHHHRERGEGPALHVLLQPPL